MTTAPIFSGLMARTDPLTRDAILSASIACLADRDGIRLAAAWAAEGDGSLSDVRREPAACGKRSPTPGPSSS